VLSAWDHLYFDPQRIAIIDDGLPANRYNPPIGWGSVHHIAGNNHFEGIARTHDGNHLLITGTSPEGGEFFIALFFNDAGTTEKWGFNLPNPQAWIKPTRTIISVLYEHTGGLGVFGDFAVIPMEDLDHDGDSFLVFYDLFQDILASNRPLKLATEVYRPGWHHAGAAAVLKLPADHPVAPDRYLMAVKSNRVHWPDEPEVHLYVSQGSDIRDPSVFSGSFTRVSTPENFEGLGLVQDCVTNEIYLIGMYNPAIDGSGLIDLAILYRVNIPPSGPVTLTYVDDTWVDSCMVNGQEWCNFNAGVGIHVTPAGRLLLYSVNYFKDVHDDGWVRLEEMGW